MKKGGILQFEADDASEMSVNGKQVFFTKRINGETTHNKLKNSEEANFFNQKENDNNDDDLFIEFKNIKYTEPVNNNKKRKIKKKKISKKQKKKKRVLRFAFFIALLVVITIFAFVSPLFNIKTINVEGSEKVSSSTVQSLSGIKIGENIFKINKKNIIKNIKENAYIDTVSIKRGLPNTLEITVKERTVAYQVKVINSYVYLDYQGYILEVSSTKGKVPIIEGLSTDTDTLLKGKRLSNDDIKGSVNTLAKIMESAKSVELWNSITSISVKDNEYILKIDKENKTIYLGNANDLTNRMTYIKIILEEEKGNEGEIFVDGNLNKGFKPYFREKVEQKETNNGKEG